MQVSKNSLYRPTPIARLQETQSDRAAAIQDRTELGRDLTTLSDRGLHQAMASIKAQNKKSRVLASLGAAAE